MLRTPQMPVDTRELLLDQVRACQQFPAVLTAPISHLSARVSPLEWLKAQSIPQRIFWSNREQTDVVAGLGEADVITVLGGDLVGELGRLDPQGVQQLVDRCHNGIGGSRQLRYFGGISFNGKADWSGLGSARFVLPRMLRTADSVHVVVRSRQEVQTVCDFLRQVNMPDRAEADLHEWNPRTLPQAFPRAVQVDFTPDQTSWIDRVKRALQLIDHEVIEKIVLAREARFQFSQKLDPIELTAKLFQATHSSFVFCLQWGNHHAFLGATPERLFCRAGRQLHSDIIAGTRPRGSSVGEDQRLAYDLLNSDKDQLEHDIVRKSIRQKLHHLVERLDVDSHASVLRLAGKQHLYSSVEGSLRSGVTEAELLHRLHPTPAVGGYPTENALPEICRLEPFPRGWYAAPLGWIGHDSSEFVVAIRSGLLEGDTLRLYSGAGIVRGSIPWDEWQEINHKIQDFVNIFGS